VPFRDGTYLELVAFIRSGDGRDNVWGWRGFLPGGGLVDYCAASDGLRGEVERLRGLGFGVEDFGEGGRRLPGGQEIRWRSAGFRQEGRVLPFLIEVLNPRERRVPGGPAADHPNGATGVSRLEISTPDPGKAREDLAALTGAPPEALELERCELAPTGGEAGQGSGPATVTLSTDAPENVGRLDPGLAHGARFTLAPETGS